MPKHLYMKIMWKVIKNITVQKMDLEHIHVWGDFIQSAAEAICFFQITEYIIIKVFKL